MIRVLGSWEDFGKAVAALQRDQSYHTDPLKNWDLAQIGRFCEPLPRSARILDAGCSESDCSVLRYLRKKGFRDLTGIDFRISLGDRMHQALPMLAEKTFRPPFRLMRGDVTRTGFPAASFDVVVCLSVIEHGVAIAAFMAEMHRLLRPNGYLYVSTDYWPEKVDSGGVKPWGLDWTIFSRNEIAGVVRTAAEAGMTMTESGIPDAGVPMVQWSGRSYTFLSMLFQRG